MLNENLITLKEASENFSGAAIPLATIKRWVYKGCDGVKLETVLLNRLYTSKEAIQRFIQRRQCRSVETVNEPEAA